MKPVTIQAHTSVINVVKFNLDGDLLFSAGNDKNVNIYSGIDFERLGNCECSSASKTIAISEDSSILYVGTGGGAVEAFEIANGKKLGSYEIENTRVKHVELSYGGKTLMVVYTDYSNNGFVQFITVKELLEYFKKVAATNFKGVALPLPASFSQISYGLCNKYMIGVTEKGMVYKFGQKGEVLKEKKVFDEGVGVEFARDYAFVAVSGNLGVKLFDPDTLEEIKFFKQDFPMRGLAISPLYNAKSSKRHIVMGGGTPAREAALLKAGGTQIHIVNMVTSEALAHIPGHFSPVNSLCFFRDGGGIVSGAEEGRIFVFRFDKTYWEDARFRQEERMF